MALECIVPDRLWHAQQPLRFGPIFITTRMTVVRLRDDSLWVHSPITPTPDLVRRLSEIGRVSFVVAPNRSHHLSYLDFLSVHPSAQGFIAPGLESKRHEFARHLRLAEGEPWGADLRSFFIEGLPVLNETAFFHRDTGTLILTDLLFSFSKENRGVASLVARVLGVRANLAMSRTMKMMVADRQALSGSVKPLLDLPVQRVVVAHDEIVTEAAKPKLAKAFAWL
ncbi:MAG: DUF4336 domain-containing protein [Gammaproteobacteria bacterium]